jgi:hypothetical protein
MILQHGPAPFDAEAAAERAARRLALVIVKADGRIEYEGSRARIVAKEGQARKVIGTASAALARDAERILHDFDPQSYPDPMSTPTAAERVNEQIDAEVASWSSDLRAFDPGPGDADARLAWVEKSRPLAKRLATGRTERAEKAREASGDPWAGGRYPFQSAQDVPWKD